MKRILLSIAIIMTAVSCNVNPFLTSWETPYGIPDFDQVKEKHYLPAVEAGIAQQTAEIEAIINNPETPNFTNTIVALEKSGARLDQVTTVFGNLLSAETNDEMQAIAERVMPKLSEHSNNISLNEKLFARIKAVYESTDKEQLNQEEQMHLLQRLFLQPQPNSII
mgnify:CR=1 FL=1